MRGPTDWSVGLPSYRRARSASVAALVPEEAPSEWPGGSCETGAQSSRRPRLSVAGASASVIDRLAFINHISRPLTCRPERLHCKRAFKFPVKRAAELVSVSSGLLGRPGGRPTGRPVDAFWRQTCPAEEAAWGRESIKSVVATPLPSRAGALQLAKDQAASAQTATN